MEGGRPEDELAELRREIDRVDEAMHRLLMERAATVDRLVAAKRPDSSGSAFRPDREAAILRVLAERHRGPLPLDAVEGIWRVITATFTYVQAPFSVHACGPSAAMRDAARFHFGFTVPYREHEGPGDVVSAVAASRGDLGLIRIAEAEGGWWRALEAPSAPKVIARLPFLDRPDHPAGTPVLVLARSPAGSTTGDIALYSTGGATPQAVRALGGEVVAQAPGGAVLLACPAAMRMDEIAASLAPAGRRPRPIPIGHHPSRFRLRA